MKRLSAPRHHVGTTAREVFTTPRLPVAMPPSNPEDTMSLLIHPVLLGSVAYGLVLATVTYLAGAGTRARVRWLTTVGAFSIAVGAGAQFL